MSSKIFTVSVIVEKAGDFFESQASMRVAHHPDEEKPLLTSERPLITSEICRARDEKNAVAYALTELSVELQRMTGPLP